MKNLLLTIISVLSIATVSNAQEIESNDLSQELTNIENVSSTEAGTHVVIYDLFTRPLLTSYPDFFSTLLPECRQYAEGYAGGSLFVGEHGTVVLPVGEVTLEGLVYYQYRMIYRYEKRSNGDIVAAKLIDYLTRKGATFILTDNAEWINL